MAEISGANMCLVAILYNLGWVTLPGYGARPYPSELFDAHWKSYNTPLTAFLSLAFCAQVSLNAEEGLYWYHLMRAVRRPQAARSWLTSSFFFAWIIISVSAMVAEFGAGWIGYVDDDTQTARMFVCAGAIELVVVCAASTVLLKFPSFLEDVKRSGAGPEVRSRLHYYHEANKVRTLFRSLFTTSVLILGIDGLTTAKVVNENRLAADLLIQVASGSYFFASVISVQLYLPRAYNKETNQPRVMVGAQPQQNHAQHGASNVQLMSLLREGGQWDEDDDLRAGMARTRTESKAFEDVEWGKEAFPEEQPGLPALENFTSPFGK
ncbi:hypothetical protein EHS25_008543 [Saitozyma podzolica]|uniref:Uncharacterized protein n=1 Tax=Saitozyma podzolica TaxID=1890683 RepID=A0A427YLX5_9TREE|nr:hypothetical protein EHS25_008543 [Saitozyma podzolica]